MDTPNKIHLVERAAEHLLRSGDAPALTGGPPGLEDQRLDDRAPVFQPQPNIAAPARPPIPLRSLVAAGLIESGTSRGRVSEEFRLVQSQLLRGAFGPDSGQAGFSNLVMVTSAKPNEGKTFTALNLAAGVARLGDRPVLLVDADPKRNSLTDKLGLIDAPGMLDLALNPSADAVPFIHPTELGLLSILPVGSQRTERPDLFASDQMTRALGALGRRFTDRFVILDVSPCLSTSDPAALAPAVGQILFVIEAEKTQREEVESSLDLIQSCPSITLLLNKVKMSTPRSFGAYSYAYTS